MADIYKAVEREYLDRLDGDSETWRVVMAILMLVAEVRDLNDMLDRRLSSLRDGQAER